MDFAIADPDGGHWPLPAHRLADRWNATSDPAPKVSTTTISMIAGVIIAMLMSFLRL